MIKQILSILLILCCYFGIKAQPSFELYYSESKLNNGDTLKIQTQPNLIDQQYIKVKNTSCCSKNVLVRKNELSLAQNTEITFCWAECYPAETMLSPEPILIEASTVCESFLPILMQAVKEHLMCFTRFSMKPIATIPFRFTSNTIAEKHQ
jgi:hypothetical protein